MSRSRILTLPEVVTAAHRLAEELVSVTEPGKRSVYPVPRGGVSALLALTSSFPGRLFTVATTPQSADIILDDLVDSGRTMKHYRSLNRGAVLAALYTKRKGGGEVFAEQTPPDEWLIFPWESQAQYGADDIVTRLLQFIGEDVEREGLKETPARVVKAWKSWFEGYKLDPKSVLKSFEDGGEGYDEMLVQRNIPVYSHCEHHLAPFFGVAHIGYIPSGRIVGLSKLSRLVDVFARRLQVQERLTAQIADALSEALEAKAVGVVLECRHMCMESRGVQRSGTTTTTSALRGLLKDSPQARAEFLSLLQPKG